MPESYREKLLSVGFLTGGRSDKPRVREYRDEAGGRVKETTLGHREEGGTTVHLDHARGDRRDVIIRPSTVRVTTKLQGVC